MTKKIFLIFCFSALFFKISAFNNLDEIKKYAEQTQEYPPMDTQNYLNPDFKSFYEKTTPGIFGRIFSKALNAVKIQKQEWSPESFLSLLKKVTQQQEQNWGTGEYVVKISPRNKTEFVIWGDIQGAYHSLTRDLIKLQEENILTKDLKINKSDYFFIFNGNSIGRSAYIMETLTIILSLMEKNKKQVFYIKGEQETAGNWKNFGLDQQLTYKAKHLSKEQIPLETEINKFLNTLPLGIYIKLPSDKVPKFIRISHFDRTYPTLTETSFADFLQQATNNDLEKFNLADKKPSAAQISIEAIIEGKDRSIQFQKTDGLQLLLPDKGSTAWTIFSAPTFSSQKVYDFFNDAFVILSVDPATKTNLITLYKQNATEKKGFAKKTYNIISEELVKEEAAKIEKVAPKPEPEVSKTVIPEAKREIKVVTNLDVSKVIASGTSPNVAGASICFQAENKTNKINHFEYIVYDNKFQPNLIKSYTEKLLADGLNIIFHPTGSVILEQMLPLIQNKNIVVFCGATSPIFRNPELKNFINYFPSSSQSAEALTNYIIEKLDIKKFAIIYPNDSYGNGAFDGCTKILKKYNFKQNIDWVEIKHKVEMIDDQNIATIIQQFNPTAILLFSYDPAARSLIDNLNPSFLLNKKLVIPEASSDLKNFINSRNLKLITSQLFPDLHTNNFEIITEYLQNKGESKGSDKEFEGYLGAGILIHLINKLNKEVTPQNILQFAENIKNEPFKGLMLNFNPATRSLLEDVWIDGGDGKLFLYKESNKEKPVPQAETKPYEITSGEKRNIQVGANLDLTSVLAPEAKPILNGITIRLREENASSKATNLKLTFFDNKLDPELIKSNTEKLLSNGINIFLQPTGSFILEKMSPLLKDKPFFLLNGATSPIFYKPEFKNFINYFSSSYQGATILTEYIIKVLNKRKIALVYQEEPFGQGAFEGSTAVLKKYNLKENTDWIALGHEIEKIDDPKIISSIKKFNPDVIIMCSFDTAIKTLLNFLGADFLFSKIFTCIEGSDEIKQFLFSKKISFVSTHLVPNPEFSNLEFVQEYRKAKDNKDLTERELEGYLAASLLLHLINNIKGEVTPQKLLEKAEGLKNQEWKGLTLNFDPKTRSILSDVWLDAGDGKPFLYKEKETEETTKAKDHAKAEEKAIPTRAIFMEKQQINLAANLDLTSVLAPNTKPTLNSLMSTFQAENQTNKKYNIKLTYFDNKLKPDLIKEYTEQILRSDFKFLIHTTGSIILEQMLPLLKDKPIFIFNGATSQIFYKPELKNFINSFPSSYKSAEILTEYIIKNFDTKKKFAVVYQQDPFSESAAQASKDVLIKHNLKKDVDWIEISHKIENIDDVKITDDIKKFNPDIIIISSLAAALKALIQRLEITFLYDKIIGTIEATTEIKEFMQALKIKNISTLVVPDPNKSSIKIVQDYKESFGKKQQDYSERELEGYMTASLLIYLFNKIDAEITPEKVLQAAEKIKNENFKGLILNFDPNTRSISNNVWIDTGEGEPFLYQAEKAPTPIQAPIDTAQIPAPEKKEEIKPAPVQAIPEPTEKQEITIGATQDLSDVLSYLSKPALNGMLLRFQEENQNSKKYRFKLVSYDNKFKPELGVEQTQKMLNDGIKIFIHSSGSKILEKMLTLFNDKSVAVQTGAASPIFQNPDLKKIYIDCPSSFRSAKAIAEYIVAKMKKENKKKKFAIIYQEESNRINAAQGFESVLKEDNLKENVDWIAISHKPEIIDAAEMAEPIKKFAPDILFIASLEAAIQSLINRLDVSYLFDKTLAIIEATPPIKEFIRSRKIQLISAQLNPDATSSNLELVKNYRDFLKKTNPDAAYNDIEFLGYMEASMMIYLINKIDGQVTPEKILAQVGNCKNEAFSKDLYLNFDPKRRTIFDAVWLDTGKGEPFLYQEEKKEEPKPTPTQTPTPTPASVPTPTQTTAPATVQPTIAQNEINIGVTLDQNGKADETIKATAIGLKLRIAKENAAGGINGKKINLIIRDDEFNPGKARENIEKFLSEDKTDIILSPVGSYPFTEILPFIKDKKIGVFFPDATSPEYQKEEYKNLINLYASSYQETKILFNYIVTQLKLKKLAIFCEDEPFSQGGLAGAKEVLEKNNLKENINWKLFPQNIQTTTSSNAFSEGIQRFDPDGIVLISLQSNTQALVLGLPKDFLSNKNIFGISSMVKVKKLLQDRGMKVVSTQIVPDPINSNYEIVKEYRRDITEKGLPIHSGSLEGYIAASIFIELLKKIEGEITKEKIIEQAEKVQNYDFKGLPLNFNRKTRNIFGCVFLDTGDAEQIMCKAEQEAPIILEKKEVKAIAQNMTKKRILSFQKRKHFKEKLLGNLDKGKYNFIHKAKA